MQPIQGLGLGVYTVLDAARLAGVPARHIRRWLWGYRQHGRSYEPLWRPQHTEIDGFRSVGFRDLIELQFVQAFRNRGVSLQTIRRAVQRAQELYEYPFSRLAFHTDGRRIFGDVTSKDTVDRKILFELVSGQLLFEFVLLALSEVLIYEDGVPVKWKPLGKNREVVIDPRRSFGRPIVERGVPTEVLADAYRAEGSVEAAARAYEVSTDAVRDALEYEEKLAA